MHMNHDLRLTTTRTVPVCRSMVYTPVIHCNYMDYYSLTDPEGMEGGVGLVG